MTSQQQKYMTVYTDPRSDTFGNAYRSAKQAGYSETTARNLTHLNPKWLSESIGHITQDISPEQITLMLKTVIMNTDESTVTRIKAAELMMKYHRMIGPEKVSNQMISISLDLVGGANGPPPQHLMDVNLSNKTSDIE